MNDSYDALGSLEASIKQQLDVNRSKNLLYENSTQIMRMEPGFLAALEELLNSRTSEPAEDVYGGIISFAARELLKRLYSINPYLQPGQAQVENLEQIYRQTWQVMIRTGNIKTTLAEFHYPALSKWLADLYPEEFQEVLKYSAAVGQVTYGEYSAELQLELLGIDTAQLRQPVLDIGCGAHASLTGYLRALGIEAYGIDRQLETDEPYLHQLNWFDFNFEAGKWGTLISNMGFTNHLNYAYLHDHSQLERYLLKMKEILESLSAGGCFYYAPGLPFIEDRLSTGSYQVQRARRSYDVLVGKIIRKEW